MILNQEINKPESSHGKVPAPSAKIKVEHSGESAFFRFPDDALYQSVVHRFENQVARHPDRVAVKWKEGSITYDELNNRANRLSNHILENIGAEHETVVLFLDHGLNMIIGMLGAMKTGKIYVPVDTSFSKDRIADIIKDSKAKIIICDNKNLDRTMQEVVSPVTIVNMDATTHEDTSNPGKAIRPDSIAYILYTSGSTGKPKGVMQNHRNVLHLVKIYTNDIKLTMEDRLLFLYSHGFAAGIKDIFGALLNGGAVCPFDVKTNGIARLPQFLLENKVSIYHSVPTIFRHLCKEFQGIDGFPDIRLVSLGSEPVSHRDFELYQKYFSPKCYFHIELGSTETGVIRQYFARHDTIFPRGYVNLGYAVTDKNVMLLKLDDEKIDDVNIGEIGVQSDYLSPGYWNRPELTERLFGIPLSSNGKSIYKTGDLGRFLPNGCLEYLGRKDFQVKVMGQRVDILGMESFICGLSGIEEAVVVPYKDSQGSTNLAAYCVPKVWPGPKTDEIRNAFLQKKSKSIVPAFFEMLRFLPHTSNGKINRSALAESAQSTLDNADQIILPQTNIERVLTSFFSELLSIENDQVGVTQNFFQLGGNSLSAVQLCSRITEAFEISIQITDIFEAPTVLDLVALMMKCCDKQQFIEDKADIFWHKSTKEKNELLIPHKGYPKTQDGNPAPLSYFQQSIWFLQQTNADNPFYNWTSSFCLTGNLNVDLLKQSFYGIVQRHESLRTNFEVLNDQPVLRVSSSIELPFGYYDFSHLSSHEFDERLRQKSSSAARHIFNLESDALMRVSVIKKKEDEHYLLVVIHHIVCDGWSMGILFDELSQEYDALKNGIEIKFNAPAL